MIITNRLGLPAPLVSLAREEYESAENEYRVTSLLRGVRETLLERRHRAEITKDVADMVWLLFGRAVHSVLEKHEESEDELKEQRVIIPFAGQYMLSGQFDLYTEGEEMITDYKTASVWKVIHNDFSDWRRQILIYGYMMRQCRFPVSRGRIVAFLKDHSKADARKDISYPQFPVETINFRFSESDFEECEQWLNAKFAEITEADKLPDDELPVCTAEERWNSGDRYAVMRKGRKTALRVLDNQAEAQDWLKTNGGDYIETRPGEDRKCRDYCSANAFCNYWCKVKEKNDKQ